MVDFFEGFAELRRSNVPYPGEKLNGKISVIDPFINDAMRTGRVRIDVENPDLKLRPDMYVDVTAVWVGMIALAGLDAETGVVMLLYLDHAWDKFRAAGRMNCMTDLHVAVVEGAVQRIRPKIMTICAI